MTYTDFETNVPSDDGVDYTIWHIRSVRLVAERMKPERPISALRNRICACYVKPRIMKSQIYHLPDFLTITHLSNVSHLNEYLGSGSARPRATVTANDIEGFFKVYALQCRNQGPLEGHLRRVRYSINRFTDYLGQKGLFDPLAGACRHQYRSHLCGNRHGNEAENDRQGRRPECRQPNPMATAPRSPMAQPTCQKATIMWTKLLKKIERECAREVFCVFGQPGNWVFPRRSCPAVPEFLNPPSVCRFVAVSKLLKKKGTHC